MTASVVQVARSTSGNPTLSSVPQAGDVVVLVVALLGPTRTVSGVAGLGATWARVARHPAEVNETGNFTHEVWAGSGATSSGTITVTDDGSVAKQVFLVRGTDGVVTSPGSVHVSQTAGFSGTAYDAAVGNVAIEVFARHQAASASTWPSTTPATGWTTVATYSFASFAGNGRDSYRVPSGGVETHQTSDPASLSSGATYFRRITSILVGTAPGTGPEVSASLTVTAGGSLTAKATRPLAATLSAAASGALTGVQRQAVGAELTVTAGGSLDGVDVPPGAQAISATLTVATGGSLSATATRHVAVTLTITAGGSLDALTEGDLTATLTATASGSLTGVEGTSVYVGATLALTAGGALSGDAVATVESTLTVTAGGSLWGARTHLHDQYGRGVWSIVAATRAGVPLHEGSLDAIDLTAPVTKRLNDVDGSGTGTAFAVPRNETDALAALPQFGEIQVSRGGHHLDTYVLLRPQDHGTAADIPYQALGLGWWLTKRRIGPPVRTQLLPKKWRAGYRAESIPAEAPKWSRVATPALVGPGLRVEGSTAVQTTVTRLGSDTTFAPGSSILSSEGKTALRGFAREVEVDRDPDDLIDIAHPVITIEGHTDSVPDYGPGGNQGLSERRAKAVYDYLLPLVPDGTTMTWVGYGETRPIVPNNATGGTEANRRVDIKYPKTVSARGHRQYVGDTLVYTNPSAHITRNLTLVAWWQLETYKEPNADQSILFLGRRPVGSGDDGFADGETATTRVDDETPLGTWTRSEVTITVPADGQAWEIVARLTPPAGTVVYDEGATNLYADDALEFVDVDQADIVKGLIEHAQDPAYGKDDLNLTPATTPTGIRRTRVYYWHERQTIASALAELTSLADGVDITIDTTPTTRTVRTHFPRAGQESDVTLSPDTHVEDYSLTLDGLSAATTAIVQADGSGPDREEGVVVGTGTLGVVLEDVWTTEPGTHVGELGEQARTARARYGGHVPVLTVTCDNDDTDHLLDRLGLGDRVDVSIPSPLLTVAGRASLPGWSIDHETDRITYAPALEV